MKHILIMETGSFKVIGGAAKDTLKIYKKLSMNPDYRIDILGDYSSIDSTVKAITQDEMMKNDYDLIWLNSIRDVPLAENYMKLHMGGKAKFMYVDRGNVLLNFEKAGLKRLLPKMIARRMLVRSMRGWLDYYIAISVDQLEHAKLFFNDKTKIHYIMIAPHEEYHALQKKGLFTGALTVSRLDERQKKISFMIQGIERLKDKHPEIGEKEVLRIVGTGRDEQRYKDLTKSSGLGKNITFEGFLSGEPLIKAYNDAGFFVSTSEWEGLGRSLLEAMACGLPLLINENINTTIGDNPRRTLVRDIDNGLIYRCGDVDDFAEKFYWLYTDQRLRDKLSSNAIEFMKQFSFDSVISKYTEIIDAL